MERNFYNRRQNNRESAKDFILQMLTLARQHPELQKHDHLERIYDGLRCEYRHYVRRSDFSSLDELISLTDEFEALKREERPQAAHAITSAYDRNQVCWRCKQTGHRRHTCSFERRLFCSYCGRDGTLTIRCGCRSATNTDGDSRYYISVVLHGLPVRALVDTGASRTHINERVADYLAASNIAHTDTQEAAQMADKSIVHLRRVFDTHVEFRQKTIALPITEITTLAEDMILGMDFLAAFGVELRLDGKIIPAIKTSKFSLSHSVFTRDIENNHLPTNIEGQPDIKSIPRMLQGCTPPNRIPSTSSTAILNRSPPSAQKITTPPSSSTKPGRKSTPRLMQGCTLVPNRIPSPSGTVVFTRPQKSAATATKPSSSTRKPDTTPAAPMVPTRTARISLPPVDKKRTTSPQNQPLQLTARHRQPRPRRRQLRSPPFHRNNNPRSHHQSLQLTDENRKVRTQRRQIRSPPVGSNHSTSRSLQNRQHPRPD